MLIVFECGFVSPLFSNFVKQVVSTISNISDRKLVLNCFLAFFLQPLASAYGLAKHRDGRWEWAIAPGVSPSPRYQHAAVGFGTHLLYFCI